MNFMLRKQANTINEEKNNKESYMDEIKKREEENYKKNFNALEDSLFEKACEMEEKAALIEQYYSQIVTMKMEIEQLQEEVDVINEEIDKKKIKTEKISLSRKVINAVSEFVISIKNLFVPKPESIEVEEVVEAIQDVEQSNLKDEKKERLDKVLNKLIELLGE